ncbi:MAG TPA: hypothetical protein VMX94_00645 [Armatimonadota bacterium]|nr:hypothetical protein [Armatimonadota bacterium]
MKRRLNLRPIMTAAILALMLVYQGTFAGEETANPSSKAVDIAGINRSSRSEYLAYLKNHAESPADYVISKFKAHDAVLLGEMHEIRENCEFVSQLIEPLYNKAGVRVIATEFVRSRNTARANQLVTAREYDEDAALRIFRDYGQPWGFREYIDILRAVWSFNRRLPPEAEKFHVLGLDSNWNECDVLFKLKDDAARLREYQRRERHMIRVFDKEVLTKRRKALVYLGYGHTFPEEKFGAVLRKKYGDRIFWVCLHHQQDGRLVGFLEGLFAENGNKPIGFDVVDSPFASLRDNTSPYFSSRKDLAFSQLAHGYVFLKPTAKLNRTTWVDGFVDKTNFESIRQIAVKRQWINENECAGPAELDSRMKQVFGSK